jgi:hypothetical protein
MILDENGPSEEEREQHSLLGGGSQQSSGDPGESEIGVLAPDQRHRAKYCLYASHFLSAWGARMWEFAIGLVGHEKKKIKEARSH